MNLIITGLMGTGKTTIGKEVAKRLGCNFIDTDEYLNKKFGSAKKILNQPNGDKIFSEIESKIANELSLRKNLVISTGGRFMLNQNNIELLKNSWYIVCLSADLNDLVERLLKAKLDTYRPRFFNAKNKLELMKKLDIQSNPFYSQFDNIHTSGVHIKQITDQLENMYKSHKR